MGVLKDTAVLLAKYPLTFVALGAAVAVITPVAAVTLARPLRPWAKRILADAFTARREAQRIAAESKEAYADLVAEIESDARAVTHSEPGANGVARSTSGAHSPS